MSAETQRKEVTAKYAEIIDRNLYSQTLRDYCYKKYSDGNYYSDCSSSICYAYKEAGYSFGILNTAGIYESSKLTTIDIDTENDVPINISDLRVGDMLEFAGTDSSRPLKIGHVEMVYSISGDTVTLCGHGSGTPSYKDMAAYCKQRYNSWASGGWRKELVCVRRYIQDDTKSGWIEEDGGWRFYLSGDVCVTNSWYLDSDGKWYWFDGAGLMVHDVWYRYNDAWYYLGSDGAMVTGQLTVDGKWYVLDNDGAMLTEPVTLTPDDDGALQWPGLTNKIVKSEYNHPKS